MGGKVYYGGYMKRLSRYAVLLLAVCCLCPTVGEAQAAGSKAPRIVNRVAATVNGRPITSAEVRFMMAPYLRELSMLYPRQGPRFNAELLKVKKQVLDELIDRELVLGEFEDRGLMFPETAINEEISRRILVQYNGRRELMLKELRERGLTLSELRESVRKELTVAAMRSSRYDRGIPPTPDEIQAEYLATRANYRDVTNDSVKYDKIFIPAVDANDPNITPDLLRALTLGGAKVRVMKKYNARSEDNPLYPRLDGGIVTLGERSGMLNMLLLAKRYRKFTRTVEILLLASTLVGSLLGGLLSILYTPMLSILAYMLWHGAWLTFFAIFARVTFRLPKKSQKEK